MFAELPDFPENEDSTTEILSTEEGTKDTAWLKKVVSRVTDQRYMSDDGQNWELDEPDVKEVTEYTYKNYKAACEDQGIDCLLRNDFEQDGTTVFRNTHFMGEEMEDVSDLEAVFRYGSGKFELHQSYDSEGQAGQHVLITSTKGVSNQREYISESGETFALSDDTETGDKRTTTMVTYGKYRAILTFTDMAEEEIHEVLDTVSINE